MEPPLGRPGNALQTAVGGSKAKEEVLQNGKAVHAAQPGRQRRTESLTWIGTTAFGADLPHSRPATPTPYRASPSITGVVCSLLLTFERFRGTRPVDKWGAGRREAKNGLLAEAYACRNLRAGGLGACDAHFIMASIGTSGMVGS